jgi:hypothetical protein
MRPIKRILFLSFLLLSACKSEKEILCDESLNLNQGNFELVSKQCIVNGSHATALVKLLDRSNGEYRTYTLNVIDGRIIMNLDSVSAISHQKSEEASAMASASMAMSASQASMNAGRR